MDGSAGDSIVRQGDKGGHLYLVQDGKIQISVTIAERQQTFTLESGDFFGAASLSEGTVHESSARALTDFRLLKIKRSELEKIIGEQPEIAIRLLERAARPVLAAPEAAESPVELESPQSPGLVYSALVLADGTEFPLLPDGETTIGRSDSAAGHTPNVDLTRHDDELSLSRRHAKVAGGDDGFYVWEEIGVQNGTFLNEVQLKSGVPAKLKDGDRLRFGLVTVEFRQRG